MARLTRITDIIQIGETDRRMRAHRYDFKYMILLNDYNKFNMMRNVAEDHLGRNYAWFHDNGRKTQNAYGPFGSHYDGKNRSPHEKHKLYFRTRLDAETVLALFTLKHGMTE